MGDEIDDYSDFQDQCAFDFQTYFFFGGTRPILDATTHHMILLLLLNVTGGSEEKARMDGECTEQHVQQGGHLEAALAEASLGDLVTVEVDGHGSVCLAARIDKACGGILWEPLKIELTPSVLDSKAPNSKILAAHLRTKLWVAPMLRDTERNITYAEAIARVVGSLPSRGGRLVIDVGTGTGLLAMLAAQAGAERVIACEMFPAVASMAEAIVEANQHMWPNCSLQVLCLHSHNLEVGHGSQESDRLPRRADLLVSELLDSTLLAEGLLPTVRDAWQRLLQPGARVVPEGCRVWAQIVQCSALQQETTNLAIPRASEESSSVTLARSDDAHHCGFAAAVPVRLQSLKDLIDPNHGSGVGNSKDFADKDDYLALSEPFLALEIDLSSESALPPVEGRSCVLEVPASASGQPHAVVYWFDLVLLREDESGPEVVYSTHPGTQSWQDHWLHASVALPGTPPSVSAGRPLRLRASHDDTALWFAMLPTSDTNTSRVDEKPPKRARKERHVEDGDCDTAGDRTDNSKTTWVPGASKAICTCGLHLAHSVQRLHTLADPLRALEWTTAVDHALAQARPAASATSMSAMDVSDGSLLAIVAAARGAGHVVSLEERDEACFVWSQIAQHQFDNGEVGKVEHIEGGERNVAVKDGDYVNDGAFGGAHVSEHLTPAIEVILARAEQIELPEGSLMNLILFDGCARGMEHRPCHAALHYWHLLHALQGRGVVDLRGGLSRSVPSAARIVGAAFTGKQVLASYGKVGHVCGFNHDVLDAALEEALGISSSTSADEPLYLALGEYSDVHEIAGTRRDLLTFDYQNLTTTTNGFINDGSAEDSLRSEALVVDLTGRADFVAYWVELDLGPPGLMLPCGPLTRGFNQAVCLLHSTAPSSAPLPMSGLEHRAGVLSGKLRMECDLTEGLVKLSAKVEVETGSGP